MSNHFAKRTSRYISGIHPRFAKARDRTWLVLAIATTCSGLYFIWQHEDTISSWIYHQTRIWPDEWALWGLVILLSLLACALEFLALHVLLTHRKRVTITQTHVKFRRWGIMRAYQRLPGSRFVIRAHDRTAKERDYHAHLLQKAQLKRKARKPRKYYQWSFTISFEDCGVAKDIFSIMGEPRCKKTLALLNADMAEIDGASGTGKGIAMNAENEWHDQAGGLPLPNNR